MIGMIRRRRAIRERPEVVQAYLEERAQVRAHQKYLRTDLIHLPLSDLRALDRDSEDELKQARREMFRALDDRDAYRPMGQREARTNFAHAHGLSAR